MTDGSGDFAHMVDVLSAEHERWQALSLEQQEKIRQEAAAKRARADRERQARRIREYLERTW